MLICRYINNTLGNISYNLSEPCEWFQNVSETVLTLLSKEKFPLTLWKASKKVKLLMD